VPILNLTVAYQNADRLSVYIRPLETSLDVTNTTWFILDETLVPRPGDSDDVESAADDGDLEFSWSNDPSFSFTVTRKSTGDAIFDTSGSVLVFEDQFVEFVTSMPENYNVYGLGERIHGLRLGNNFTATIYAADAGDPIDYNIYGSHPVYLDTRYYEVSENGSQTLVTSNETDANTTYQSYSHGVFLRNAHGQEILMRSDNITWRTIGGSLDLYFYAGPSAPEVIKQHQEVIGFPAMQQYFTFGYHQCRWGYQNWTVLQDVVDNFAALSIPLENIWTDIDYMKHYRDFEMDPNTFPVNLGQQFLSKLHDNHQHYIPIVDSAIYIPNPDNATDAYAPYNRGNEVGAFLNNPDGSQYIGSVWPGYTVFPDWLSENASDWWSSEMVGPRVISIAKGILC
jgi:alpha-glucosidase